MDAFALNVNGQTHAVDLSRHVRLVDVLREELGLRGTHEGCATASTIPAAARAITSI